MHSYFQMASSSQSRHYTSPLNSNGGYRRRMLAAAAATGPSLMDDVTEPSSSLDFSYPTSPSLQDYSQTSTKKSRLERKLEHDKRIYSSSYQEELEGFHPLEAYEDYEQDYHSDIDEDEEDDLEVINESYISDPDDQSYPSQDSESESGYASDDMSTSAQPGGEFGALSSLATPMVRCGGIITHDTTATRFQYHSEQDCWVQPGKTQPQSQSQSASHSFSHSLGPQRHSLEDSPDTRLPKATTTNNNNSRQELPSMTRISIHNQDGTVVYDPMALASKSTDSTATASASSSGSHQESVSSHGSESLLEDDDTHDQQPVLTPSTDEDGDMNDNESISAATTSSDCCVDNRQTTPSQLERLQHQQQEGEKEDLPVEELVTQDEFHQGSEQDQEPSARGSAIDNTCPSVPEPAASSTCPTPHTVASRTGSCHDDTTTKIHADETSSVHNSSSSSSKHESCSSNQQLLMETERPSSTVVHEKAANSLSIQDDDAVVADDDACDDNQSDASKSVSIHSSLLEGKDQQLDCSSQGSQQQPKTQVPLETWEQLQQSVQVQLQPLCDMVHRESSNDNDANDEMLDRLKKRLQQEYQHQSPTEQVASAAFFQAFALSQQIYQSKLQQALQVQEEAQQPSAELRKEHLQALDDHHQQQDQVQEQKIPSGGGLSSEMLEGLSERTRSFLQTPRRFRYHKDAGDNKSLAGHDEDDTKTVATAMSTMSCRELSIARFQRERLRAKFRQNRQQQQQSQEVMDAQNAPSRSAPTTDEDDRIQQLLEELQQAERRQKKLEQQLQQAGVVLAEDIPYDEAKQQVARISRRMNEIGTADVTHDDPVVQKTLREEYFRLEKDMEKYMNALLLTDEYMQEQQTLEQEWEDAHATDNRLALECLRRHMPVSIRSMTKAQLVEAGLPASMALKFQRTNVLQLLRRDPQAIAKWHPSNLESLRLAGLTLTERRALHSHLLPVLQEWNERSSSSSDPLLERKRTWMRMMRSNFKESLQKYQQHVRQTDGVVGPDHSCSLIGRQCPVRANHLWDYSGDLGFPVEDLYDKQDAIAAASCPFVAPRTQPRDDGRPVQNPSAGEIAPGSSAGIAKEIVRGEGPESGQLSTPECRLEALRDHYKNHTNKVRVVSEALGICESMEKTIDKMEEQRIRWIQQQLKSKSAVDDQGLSLVIQFLSGFLRDVGSWLERATDLAEDRKDPRSLVEIGLLEEVYGAACDYLDEAKEYWCVDSASSSGVASGKRGPANGDLLRFQQILSQTRKVLRNIPKRNRSSSNFRREEMPKTRQRQSRTEIMAGLWKTGSYAPPPPPPPPPPLTATESDDGHRTVCPTNKQKPDLLAGIVAARAKVKSRRRQKELMAKFPGDRGEPTNLETSHDAMAVDIPSSTAIKPSPLLEAIQARRRL